MAYVEIINGVRRSTGSPESETALSLTMSIQSITSTTVRLSPAERQNAYAKNITAFSQDLRRFSSTAMPYALQTLMTIPPCDDWLTLRQQRGSSDASSLTWQGAMKANETLAFTSHSMVKHAETTASLLEQILLSQKSELDGTTYTVAYFAIGRQQPDSKAYHFAPAFITHLFKHSNEAVRTNAPHWHVWARIAAILCFCALSIIAIDLMNSPWVTRPSIDDWKKHVSATIQSGGGTLEWKEAVGDGNAEFRLHLTDATASSGGKWTATAPAYPERAPLLKSFTGTKMLFAYPPLNLYNGPPLQSSGSSVEENHARWIPGLNINDRSPTFEWTVPFQSGAQHLSVSAILPKIDWDSEARNWVNNDLNWKKVKAVIDSDERTRTQLSRLIAENEKKIKTATTTNSQPRDNTNLEGMDPDRNAIYQAGILLCFEPAIEYDRSLVVRFDRWRTRLLELPRQKTIESSPLHLSAAATGAGRLKAITYNPATARDDNEWLTQAESLLSETSTQSDSTQLMALWDALEIESHFNLYPALLSLLSTTDSPHILPTTRELLLKFAAKPMDSISATGNRLLSKSSSEYSYSYSYCYYVLDCLALYDLSLKYSRLVPQSDPLWLDLTPLRNELRAAITKASKELTSAIDESKSGGIRYLANPAAPGDRSVSSEILYTLWKIDDVRTDSTRGDDSLKSAITGIRRNLVEAMNSVSHYIVNRSPTDESTASTLGRITVTENGLSYTLNAVRYQDSESSHLELCGAYAMAQYWIDRTEGGTTRLDPNTFKLWRATLGVDDNRYWRLSAKNRYHWYNMLFLARTYEVALRDLDLVTATDSNLHLLLVDLKNTLYEELGNKTSLAKVNDPKTYRDNVVPLNSSVGLFHIATETLLTARKWSKLQSPLRQQSVSP